MAMASDQADPLALPAAEVDALPGAAWPERFEAVQVVPLTCLAGASAFCEGFAGRYRPTH
jgi:hypothetical protein